jgi:hypothetical protein
MSRLCHRTGESFGHRITAHEQTPSAVQPDTADFYAAGYGEGVGDVLGEEMQNAEMQAQGMPTVGPISEEELRASDQEMERQRREMEEILGRTEGPDEEAIEPRPGEPPPMNPPTLVE